MITSIFLYLLLLFLKFRGHHIYIYHVYKSKKSSGGKKKKSQQDYF